MKFRLAVVTLVSLTAFTQQPPRTTLIGTVEKISGNEFQVKAGARLVTFHADSNTEVWKGRTSHDLSALKIGDEVSVRGFADASGSLIASNVWAQMITFSAVIRKVDRANSEFLTGPKGTAGWVDSAGSKVVHYFPNTGFFSSDRALIVGEEVLVTGLVLPNGSVDATRIARYNADLPLNRLLPARPRP